MLAGTCREMKPFLLKLSRFPDIRGQLLSFDLMVLPFQVKRLFTICVNSNRFSRGGHAHKVCWQALIPTDSSIEVEVTNLQGTSNFFLGPGQCLVVPPLTWLTVNFSRENSSIVVLASHEYDEDDYIRDKKTLFEIDNI